MSERTQRVFSLFLTLSCILSLSSWFGVAQPQPQNTTTTIPVNVGVVLDMDQWMGKMGLSCISMALSDFYASHDYYKTRLVLNTRDSKDDVVGAAAAGSPPLSLSLSHIHTQSCLCICVYVLEFYQLLVRQQNEIVFFMGCKMSYGLASHRPLANVRTLFTDIFTFFISKEILLRFNTLSHIFI